MDMPLPSGPAALCGSTLARASCRAPSSSTSRYSKLSVGTSGTNPTTPKRIHGTCGGRVTATKQRTWSGTKVNWFVVLARGKVHVEVMPEDWGLTGAGLAQFVRRLPGILRKMLGPGAPLPRNLFTDRGTGLYSSQGFVVGKYESAVRQEGFSLYWGPDASAQAPDMGDLLLHETAVAWLRRRLRSEKPAVRPWEGTCEQWTERVRKVVRGINADYDVRGLCNEFPGRLAECVAKRGDRLRK